MHSRFVVSGLTMLALSITACGGDATGPHGALSADESAELAMQLGATAAMSAAGSVQASRVPNTPGLSLAAVPVTMTIDDPAVPCPLGGQTHLSFSLSGTVDQAAQTANLEMSGTNAPQNCAFRVRQAIVHVTGSVTQTAHINVDHGAPIGLQTFSSNGSFDWSTNDGRSGTCSIESTVSADYANNTLTVHGSACGTTMNYSGPLTAPAA